VSVETQGTRRIRSSILSIIVLAIFPVLPAVVLARVLVLPVLALVVKFWLRLLPVPDAGDMG
jgi:hypothetical protein